MCFLALIEMDQSDFINNFQSGSTEFRRPVMFNAAT